MGMFDSFMLEVKCPHCGKVKEREFQTKLFEKRMQCWRKGDRIYVEGLCILDMLVLDLATDCMEDACIIKKPKRDEFYTERKWINCDVEIKDGIVLGAIGVKKGEN